MISAMQFMAQNMGKEMPCMILCRLSGRIPRTYMINMDFTKIVYQATDNDVRIYMETSNGIQMNNKDYSKVDGSIC